MKLNDLIYYIHEYVSKDTMTRLPVNSGALHTAVVVQGLYYLYRDERLIDLPVINKENRATFPHFRNGVPGDKKNLWYTPTTPTEQLSEEEARILKGIIEIAWDHFGFRGGHNRELHYTRAHGEVFWKSHIGQELTPLGIVLPLVSPDTRRTARSLHTYPDLEQVVFHLHQNDEHDLAWTALAYKKYNGEIFYPAKDVEESLPTDENGIILSQTVSAPHTVPLDLWRTSTGPVNAV